MMKKLLILIAVLSLTIISVHPAQASMVSFLQPIEGIDGDISAWSTDSSVVSLGTSSLSILGGTGYVTGYSNIGNSTLGVLTQSGTDGLGVGSNNLVDPLTGKEAILFNFNYDLFFNYFEISSLYTGEAARLDLYNNGQLLEVLNASGSSDGIVAQLFETPYLIDGIACYVPDGNGSDFKMAKIDVSAVPEPATMLLFGPALLGLIGLRKKVRA